MKKKIHFAAALLILLFSFKVKAQETEDLLSLVDSGSTSKTYIKSAFKSTRVVNGHSMEFLSPVTMDFRILHRFGQLDQGYKNFFGLDQASMRMGFDFGLFRNLMLGVGRSTYKKELDGYFKYAPVMQSTGNNSFPMTIAFAAGVTMNTSPWADPSIKNYFFFTPRLLLPTHTWKKIL